MFGFVARNATELVFFLIYSVMSYSILPMIRLEIKFKSSFREKRDRIDLEVSLTLLPIVIYAPESALDPLINYCK